MHRFIYPMGKAVEGALKSLLSTKHLYQSIELDLGFTEGVANEIYQEQRRAGPTLHSVSSGRSLEAIIAGGKQVATQTWSAYVRPSQGKIEPVQTIGSVVNPLSFELPTINTFCDHCGERWPFNPVLEGSTCILGGNQNQWWYLGYQCQQCKGPPVRFLVRRNGLKLRLAGRDPIEALPTPKVLLKSVSKYYSDAQIAFQAGQTLAALFLLRVFVEQFWKTIEAVQQRLKQDPRATGENLGDAYQGTLPNDFRDRFPSLKEIYGDLSAAIHQPDANDDLFNQCCNKVVKHFEARRLYEIT